MQKTASQMFDRLLCSNNILMNFLDCLYFGWIMIMSQFFFFFGFYLEITQKFQAQQFTKSFPGNIHYKLNIHQTFRRRPICLLNSLCTLCTCPWGCFVNYQFWKFSDGVISNQKSKNVTSRDSNKIYSRKTPHGKDVGQVYREKKLSITTVVFVILLNIYDKGL